MYTRTNTFILGFFVPADAIGMYNGGEKVVKASNRILTPLSETFFPRMSEYAGSNSSKEGVFRKKVALVMIGIASLACIVLLGVAPYAVPLIFGEGYDRITPVIQIMALSLPFVAVNNVLGVQWMIPHGLDTVYQNILITAGILNLVLAVLLAWLVGIYGVAVLVPSIEAMVGIMMGVSLYRHNKISGYAS